MNNPFVDIARKFALRRHTSHSDTALLPFRDIQTAAVWMDATCPNPKAEFDVITEFFKARGIDVRIYALYLSDVQNFNEGQFKSIFVHKRHLNWFGRIKKGEWCPEVKGDEDLLMSLLPSDIFAVTYAAACSTSPMKVGRDPRNSSIYNFLVQDKEGETMTQMEAFAAMNDFLMKIQ